jgi:hypothetical protein
MSPANKQLRYHRVIGEVMNQNVKVICHICRLLDKRSCRIEADRSFQILRFFSTLMDRVMVSRQAKKKKLHISSKQ